MDASLVDVPLPWFVAYAAEPFELLRVIHPFLNASTLPPPANPIRLARHHLDKRSSCGSTSNGSGTGNNGNTNSSNKSNTGALVGAIVGSIVGTLLLAVLAFWLYRRSQRQKQQQNLNNANNVNNNAPNLNTPFKEDPSAMAAATPFLGGTPPPLGTKTTYDMSGLNYTPVVYPGAPSITGSSSYGGKTEASYYNYAPPPPSSPDPTISSGMGGMGVGYYASTPAPPFVGHPSSTPSPPPPSVTPGATSTHSGVSSNPYQPWAVPLGMSGVEAVAGGSSDAPFPNAHEEKARYSRWQQHPSTAGSGSGANSEKAGLTGMAKVSGGPTVCHASSSTTSANANANTSGPTGDGREGAISPGIGISGREGALSPTPGLPPPAYSAQ